MALSNQLETINVTITNGTFLSPGIALGAKRLLALVMPAGWTAAPITFQASHDGGTTWNDLFDMNGNPLIVSAARALAGQTVMLPFQPLRGVAMLKVRSGTAGATVAQSADRVIGLAIDVAS